MEKLLRVCGHDGSYLAFIKEEQTDMELERLDQASFPHEERLTELICFSWKLIQAHPKSDSKNESSKYRISPDQDSTESPSLNLFGFTK